MSTVNVIELHDFISEIIAPDARQAYEKCYHDIFSKDRYTNWHELFPQIDTYILPPELKAKFFLDYPKKYYFTYLKFTNRSHRGIKQVYIDNIYTVPVTATFFEETYISSDLVIPAITMRFNSEYEVYIARNMKCNKCVNVSVNKGRVNHVRHSMFTVKKRYLKYTTKSEYLYL